MSRIRNKIVYRLLYMKRFSKRTLYLIISFFVLYFLCMYVCSIFKFCQQKTNNRFVGPSFVVNTPSVRRRYSHYAAQGQVCVHPELEDRKQGTLNNTTLTIGVECNVEPDWTEVFNGTLWITDYALKTYHSIQCQYSSIIRPSSDDDSVNFGNVITFSGTNKVKAPSDYFRIVCKSKNGSFYMNVHATIVAKDEFRSGNTKAKDSSKLNVLMFGFDTVSRLAWQRFLPQSHDYFLRVLNGIVLNGYNIVGDGTPQALLPILTGKSETELPESRRGFPNAKTVDDYPWIWKKYEESGYVTHWAEDMAYIGTFNLRMKGFRKEPVHHYMRPYFLVTEKLHFKQKPFCFGRQARHNIMMNWIKDSYEQYRNIPKFIFTFHSEYSHGDYERVQMADMDLLKLLQYLHDNNHLNNTVLILMSDHGPRFLEHRKTLQGKLEERMPYFAFRFPTWFTQKYYRFYDNFVSNSHKLSTPFDIHETLLDILRLGKPNDDVNLEILNVSKEINPSYSLFEPVPITRSCADAQISSHWCACLRWDEVSNESLNALKAVRKTEKTLNEWTEKYRSKCHKLNIVKIYKAYLANYEQNMLKFEKSIDEDGRIPGFSFNNGTHTKIQIMFKTVPGNGNFEATLDVITSNGTEILHLSPHEISRINRYGDQPNCIVKTAPHLRPYCVCK